MPSLGCGCALLGSLLLVGLVISVGTVVLDDPHAGPPPEEVEGIPPVLLEAYTRGPEILDSQEHAQCTGMRWSILAGVGDRKSVV